MLSSIPPIDFFGQARAEFLIQLIITSFTLVAFFVGFYTQSVQLLMRIFLGGALLSLILIVPSWGYLRANPVQFVKDTSVPSKSPKK